jgi:hypothetical protein
MNCSITALEQYDTDFGKEKHIFPISTPFHIVLEYMQTNNCQVMVLAQNKYHIKRERKTAENVFNAYMRHKQRNLFNDIYYKNRITYLVQFN